MGSPDRAPRAGSRLHGRSRPPERVRDRAAGRRRRRAARAVAGRGARRRALGAARPARGRRHRHRLPRLRVPERAHRPLACGGSSCSAARRPTPATPRSSISSAPTSRRRRWLAPLVAGTIRSFFSMTEPEVPGSDPTTLRTRAVRDGDDWVIDGHKWFSSGAEGAAFGIVMAVTDPDAAPHARATQIIVPADTPGVEVVRPIVVMGHAGKGWSTHCEVRYTGVRVPVTNTLGDDRRRLPDRAEAPRPGPHPPRDALARPDAARLRADVHATRSSARRRRARSPTSRPCRTGSPTATPRSRRAG